MATTYKQALARATALEFRQRVRMTLARVAGDVVGEATAGSGTLRDKRHDHGLVLLHSLDRDEYVSRYAFAVCVEPALMNIDQIAGEVTGSEIPDNTLFTNVRNLFPKFAGVKNGDV